MAKSIDSVKGALGFLSILKEHHDLKIIKTTDTIKHKKIIWKFLVVDFTIMSICFHDTKYLLSTYFVPGSGV